MKPLAFTIVTLLSFAALPVLAQDTDEDADAEDIAEVVEEVIEPSTPTVEVESDLPVTLPDAAAVPSGRLDTPEAVFLADALRDGAMQIASAALARDRSDDPGVKALAERIGDEHEESFDRLGKLREADAATEPRGRPQHPEAGRLTALEDEAFDAAWLAVQVQYYRQAIPKFERASASTALDVEVRSAATEALAMLRSQLDAVEDLQDSLGFD